jgi:PAS domain S-box-containing protein
VETGAALPQKIIDSVSAQIAVLDREGTIVLINESWNRFARENQAGESDKACVGVNYLEVCRTACGESCEGAQEVLAGLKGVLNGHIHDFAFEYPCHSPTVRRWFLLQASGLDDPAGGAVVVHIDITARKELEARQREHEERFRGALQNSPVVVFNQDRELRYTWINSPVLAWAVQGHMGRTDMEIVGGPESERLTAIKREVLESGEEKRAEVSITFEGEIHYFDLNVVPLRDEVGAIQGVTCACTDITLMKRTAAERERLAEELATVHQDLMRRNVELEALNKEKTIWLAMAAHDLRNPLSAILANCELLTAELEAADPEVKATLQSIQSSGERSLKLLDDVLDISVIEIAQQRFSPVLIDLRQLVEETIALARPVAWVKQIRIEARYPERLSAVALDRLKIARVLLNLMENAIKFSADGTGILLVVDQQPAKVLISVYDNGPGILPDELGSIFTLLRRSRGPTSKQVGTGLGLAICKRIVEQHGGQIWAENGVSGGAVFHVSLPLDAS